MATVSALSTCQPPVVASGVALDSISKQLPFSFDKNRKQLLQSVFKQPRRQRRERKTAQAELLPKKRAAVMLILVAYKFITVDG